MGIDRPRLSSPARMLALAGCLFLLALLVVAEAPAHAQPQPPDDAPSETFPDRSPSAGPAPLEPFAPPVTRAPPMIGGGIWLAEGPGPAILGQVEAITPGPNEVVGAIHTVAAHPSDPDVLYIGATNGGIWKTTNATATNPIWTPLTDSEASLSIGALDLDPTDPTDMTLVAGVGRYSSFSSLGGARTGTLLKTTDGGATWSSLAGFIGVFSPAGISGVAARGMDIAVSVNVSDAFFCADVGIWYSTDGGATFTSVNPTSVPPGPLGIAFDLAGDPAVPATLYTALTFVGSTCSPGSGFVNGVYKSVDTGVTWVKVSDPTTMDPLIVDGTTNNIEIAVDGMDVYVNIIQSGRSVGIFHSADGGTSWTAMDLPRTPEGAPLPIMAPGAVIPGTPIFIDTSFTGPHGLPTSPGAEVEIMGVAGTVGANGVWTTSIASPTLFSLVGSSDPTAWVPGTGTWVKVVGLSPKEKPGAQGGIHASILADAATPTTVYVGGDRQDSPFPNFIGAGDFSGRLFRGDTTVAPTGAIPSPQWENLTNMTVAAIPGGGTIGGSSPHADSREMVFDANGNLVETDDGGVYRRTSPGSSAGDWFSINGNLQVTEMHDVAYDSVSDVIISGNQDTGTTQQQAVGGNLTWDSLSTADGGDVAVDDLTAAPGVSTRYSSFQLLGLWTRREFDSSNGLLTTTTPTQTLLGGSPPPVYNFVNPVELNAITPTSLVLGAFNDIYESFDKGDSINALLALGVTSFAQNAIAYGGVKAAVPNPDVLWVGSGAVVQIRTAADPAPLVATPTAFPGATVTDIVLDPTDWGTAYVSDATGVFQTHDSGATWTAITGNITDIQLRSLVIDPGPPGRLFAGGRDGVYEIALPPPGVAAVGPFVWGEIGTGLPNAPVWDMEWDATDGKLVVGTLGRGAWSLQENGACGGGLVPDRIKVRNQWIAATQLDKACTRITGGPALDIGTGGDLTFMSPTILLQTGFTVKAGGLFEADNTSP